MNANTSWPSTLIGVCLTLAALTACSSRTAQEKGQEMATMKLDMATGIGDALQAKGVLHAQLFDALNNEIGRSSVRIARTAEEAKYEALPLDPLVRRSDIRRIAFVFKPGASN